MSDSQPKLPALNESHVHDRLDGLEKLIRQQHVVIKELLLQQTQLLDARLPVYYKQVDPSKLSEEPGGCASEIALDADDRDTHEGQSAVMTPGEIKMSDSTESEVEEVIDQLQPPGHISEYNQESMKADTSGLIAVRDFQVRNPKHWLIQHPYFLTAIYLAILANAFQLGLQVDLNFGAWSTLWTVLDYVFTAVFAIEMVVSIACLRLKYFQSVWYVLDFFVAWSSIIDTCFLRLALGDADGHPILRAFQFLRLLRMVKVLKMRRDLQCLITGIAKSMTSMFWVVVLLVLIIYTYAILSVDIVGRGGNEIEYAKFEEFDPVERFGTLSRAMFTLFSISILDAWADIVWPICEVQPYFAPAFFAFLVMTSFALLNAIIGIVVDQTLSASADADEKDQKAKRDLKVGLVQKLIELVKEIDTSHDGTVTREEMANVMQNPDFMEVMEAMELPPGFKGTDLHVMLIEDGSDRLSYQDFVAAMFKLICCDDFQNLCLMKLSLAQIKEGLAKLRHDMHAQKQLLGHHLAVFERQLSTTV